ncbi:MAG: hypothetical protein U1E69_14730 [Tabrizicola sp.]|uniref:hypothetical protein n=1 Tax=Tabrizicola sp. TaxID=2005166 RepID=UPI002ABCADD5|nr:hypothetical protein [Tabrizicola sp.]MDZ4088042.1 hypothetical protein [Tabrizicola sp.]
MIDFVEVLITTKRNTDRNAVRRWVAECIGESSIWCKQVDGSKNSACQFRVSIYDPTVSLLMRLDKRIADSPAGLARSIEISELEISVDFYSRSGSDEERLAMFGILQRTLLPATSMWEQKRMHPRFTWGKQKNETRFLLPRSRSGTLHHSLPDSPYLDSTVYYGEENSDWEIRVQNKVADQRRDTDARTLNRHEKRARIEVTLAGDRLTALKLKTLGDLDRVSFTTVQGEFFHFALPTFTESAFHPQLQSAEDELNRREREQFRGGGVACLERLRSAKKQWLQTVPTRMTGMKISHLQQLRNHLRAKGIALKDRRAGRGLRGTTVAYAELNDMVRSALRDLERRIKGGEKRS